MAIYYIVIKEALMYELIEIINDDVTRFIKLKNMDSGIVEECFDDSAVVSESNFDFMEIGYQYECKIKLFGEPDSEKTEGSVVCRLINRNVTVGKKIMVEVEVDSNKYYIPQTKVKEYLDYDSFNFKFTRKDLVQVNDIIHDDLL